eukprot:10139794-Heterocapsa_arctica.AAC.1
MAGGQRQHSAGGGHGAGSLSRLEPRWAALSGRVAGRTQVRASEGAGGKARGRESGGRTVMRGPGSRR